jgi:ketosteroid isomerase-like protein
VARYARAWFDAWPGFFEWQVAGASSEIESLEVTAGADVAYAFALLRCGTPEELCRDPDRRLRLTLGLRRDDGRWVVARDHSFADDRPAEEI